MVEVGVLLCGSRVLVDLSPRSFSSLDDGCAVGTSAASEAASRSSQQKQPEVLAEIWRHRRIQRMRIHLRLWINHEVSLRYDAVADLLFKSAVLHLCRRSARDLCSLNISAVISSFKETDFWIYLFSSVCVFSFYTPLTMSLTNPQLLSCHVF